MSFLDYHRGDREELSFSSSACTGYVYGHYCLFDLTVEENKASNDSWILFEGTWGDEGSAPKGPHFRTDASNWTNWQLAKYPPYNRDENCSKRYDTLIYGAINNSIYEGPWRWASGYGIDFPWESANDCRRSTGQLSIINIIFPLLFGPFSPDA